MRLSHELIKLPFTFDTAKLAEEVAQFASGDWRPLLEGYPGITSIPLISVEGDPDHDSTRGPMRPTSYLDQALYIRQVLASFRAVWGRTRLIRVERDAQTPPRKEIDYYSTQHAQVHVPIMTRSAVEPGDEELIEMSAGEAWIVDTWERRNVLGGDSEHRIHLVAETIGSAEFWESAERGLAGVEPRHIAFAPLALPNLATETFNHPIVMSPAEQGEMVDLILSGIPEVSSEAGALLQTVLLKLRRDWTAAWARFGENKAGFPLYKGLIGRTRSALEPLAGNTRLTNGTDAAEAMERLVLRPALDERAERTLPTAMHTRRPALRSRRISQPIFIVCAPRAGNGLLFERMARSPSLWTVGESHSIIEDIAPLHPARRRFHSNRLTAADATPEIIDALETRFLRHLRDHQGRAPRDGASGLRLLEKTPRNSLRVPFLAEAFPDARFIFLYRDMRDTISAMLDAWKSGKFVTYPNLPGWEGPPWSLVLTPGWRELSGRSLPEIVAGQWASATRYLLDDLEQLHPDQWCVARYGALLRDPQSELERLARFVGAEWDFELDSPLPLPAQAEQPSGIWSNDEDLEIALPLVEEVAARSRELFADFSEEEESSEPLSIGTESSPLLKHHDRKSEFRSSHTKSFATLLESLGSSLIVSTYQSGRIILVRSIDGRLNTHLRAYPSPMGIAVGPRRLAIGTQNFIWFFQNHGKRKADEDATETDATWIPVSARATGDIRIHELVWAGETLVAVNTRFSCLSVLDPVQSFRPVWRPSFITAISPEDRCHLNGVATVEGKVRYVTALGESDDPSGWRSNKLHGGIVIDLQQNEIISRGLSMPHSPRWHDGKLWVLESAEGRLCTIDAATGQKEVVAAVPGFARGLAFAGPFAFIGLSQVREKVFDGMPVAARHDRACGVWAVDTRSGETVAFLRFEGIVQEIFDVQLMAGVRQPDLYEPYDPIVGSSFVLDQSMREQATSPPSKIS